MGLMYILGQWRDCDFPNIILMTRYTSPNRMASGQVARLDSWEK